MALDQKEIRKLCRKLSVKLVSPRIKLSYPKLNTPDTKWKEEGEWRAPMVYSAEQAPGLVDHIEALRDKAYEEILAVVQKDKPKTKKLKIADPSYKNEEDDEGEETGNVIFNAKLKASYKPKEGATQYSYPQLVDSKQAKFPRSQPIWGGTEAKVAFTLVPFFVPSLGVGVRIELRGVQILDLVSSGDSGPLGFEDEEGFDASDIEQPEAGEAGYDTDDDSDTGTDDGEGDDGADDDEDF